MEETQRSNVYLTGFSGTGKSTIGKMLAQEIGYSFIDLDSKISEKSGRTITRIFADSGEEIFRDWEKSRTGERPAIANAYKRATGGGAVISSENPQVNGWCGVIVCLEARPRLLPTVGYAKWR